MGVSVTDPNTDAFLNEAVWAVDEAGYSIVAGRISGTSDPQDAVRDLVVPNDQRWRPERRLYNPLVDHKGLFREFAEIHTGPPFDRYEEEVVRFADQYGPLGLEQTVITTDSGEEFHGELQADWGAEITAMRQCLDLWDAFADAELEPIRSTIRFEESGVVYEPSDSDSFFTIASQNWYPEVWEFIRPGDHFDAAICFVQQAVNRRLAGRVSPRLLWNDDRTIELHQVPSNLAGVMWLQLALAIDGRKSYRRCRSDGKWIEISQDGARATRQFCSDACRSREYRRRRTEAVRMHEHGLAVEEIAKTLPASVSSVRNWVGTPEEDQS